MKPILTFLAIMLSVVAAYSQDTETATSTSPRIGLRVGYNATTVHGSNFDGKWKSGLNAGITYDCAVSGSWIVRPGVYFSMKGFQEGGSYSTDYKSEFNYVEIPVLAVYRQEIGRACKFELQAGPYFAYGVSGKSDKRTLKMSPYDYYTYYKTFDNFKRFDWGLDAGAGVMFGDLYIGVSYDLGFVSIIRHALNHCFMASVGYMIH